MVSSFTPNKSIEQPANNDYVDSWDVPVNADWSIIDKALGASVTINLTGLSGNQTLTLAQYQPLKIVLSGAPTAATTIRVPANVGGLWIVRNTTTGGFVISINSLAGGASVAIPAGTQVPVSCDGTATGMFLVMTAPGLPAGATTQVQYNNAGALAGSANLTFNGTTLTTTGLTNTGNTVLGNAIADTTTVSGPLTAASTITSTSGGYVFPDGTTQATAGGGWRKIGRIVPADGRTSIAFTNLPADINDIMLTFDLTPQTNTVDLLLQFYNAAGVLDNDPSYACVTIAGHHAQTGDAPPAFGSTGMGLNNGIAFNGMRADQWRVSNVVGGGIAGHATIPFIRDTTRYKRVTFQSFWLNEYNSLYMTGQGGGIYYGQGAGLITGFRLVFSTGAMAAGGGVSVWGAT